MDGSTKATESAMFVSTTDLHCTQTMDDPEIPRSEVKRASTNPTEARHILDSTTRMVDRLFRHGYFNKPWILIPLNFINYHWAFVAILNGSYLGTDQNKTFSGYLYYDSMKPNMTRTEEIQVLHNKGVLNILVYANLVYGHPRLTGVDIRQIIFDPNSFARISVPKEDFIRQEDGSNCGFFVFLNFLEMSLVHCPVYLSKRNFKEARDEMGIRYFLQPGDWYKLYTDVNNPRKKPAKGKSNYLPSQFFETMRVQTLCLMNRILTMKKGKNYAPRNPGDENVVPTYIRRNFRKYVWDIDDKDQKSINNFNNWLNGNEKDLNQLLRCKNPIVRSPELIFGDEREEGDALPTIAYTVEQLEHAGMQNTQQPQQTPVGTPLAAGTEDENRTVSDDRTLSEEVTEASQPQPKSTKRISEVIQEIMNVPFKPHQVKPAAKWKKGDLQPISPGPNKSTGLVRMEYWEADDLKPISPSVEQSKKRPPTEENMKSGSTVPARKKPRKQVCPTAAALEDEKYSLPRLDETIHLTEDQIQLKFGHRTHAFYAPLQKNPVIAARKIAGWKGLPDTREEFFKWRKIQTNKEAKRGTKVGKGYNVSVAQMDLNWRQF